MLEASKVTKPENAQSKWERDLQLPDQSYAWEQVYASLRKTTNDVKLRWLQTRIIHRILPTNRLLSIFGIKESAKCERCSSPAETILHLFWECNSCKIFWEELRKKLSLDAPFTAEEVLLGTMTGNEKWTAASMRLCILLGKQYIWQIKHNGSEINVRVFFAFLKKNIWKLKDILQYAKGR